MTELYKKHRPKNLDGIVGQSSAVSVLSQMIENDEIPHAILLTGPSGVGKTTIARILRKHLKCNAQDFTEVNIADIRGIDNVRDIRRRMSLRPLHGKTKVWLLDECFIKDTMVVTPHGFKAVQTFKPGDTVYSAAGQDEVIAVFEKQITLNRLVCVHLGDGSDLYCSDHHLFYTDEGWKFSQDLTKKDLIFSFDKTTPVRIIRVDGVTHYKPTNRETLFDNIVSHTDAVNGFITLYDLQVKHSPTYFVGFSGVLVHNCHKLSGDAQTALLKMLEDTPKHVYFMLATTDPHKLIKTIRTRCTEIALKPIGEKDLAELVLYVWDKERNGESLSENVISKIVESSEGSARKALVLLDSVIHMESEEDALEAVEKSTQEAEAYKLCGMLLYGKPWTDIVALLKELDGQDAEGIRHLMLRWMRTVLFGGGPKAKRASYIMGIFERNFFDSGHDGLALACWEAMGGK